MQDAQIFQELNIARAELKFDTQLVHDLANYAQRLILVRWQRPQRGVARVAGRSQELADAVVADEFAVLLEEEWPGEAGARGNEATVVLTAVQHAYTTARNKGNDLTHRIAE